MKKIVIFPSGDVALVSYKIIIAYIISFPVNGGKYCKKNQIRDFFFLFFYMENFSRWPYRKRSFSGLYLTTYRYFQRGIDFVLLLILVFASLLQLRINIFYIDGVWMLIARNYSWPIILHCHHSKTIICRPPPRLM